MKGFNMLLIDDSLYMLAFLAMKEETQSPSAGIGGKPIYIMQVLIYLFASLFLFFISFNTLLYSMCFTKLVSKDFC